MLCLQPSLALSQDASGRYRSERVHYMPLCEEEVPTEAASEQPAAAAKEHPAAEVKAEVKAEPAAAADPKQESDAQPAGADLVPSFIAVGGGTPSATTAGGDTEMAEAAAVAEDGADGADAADAADAPAADAPVTTPEKQALAAEVEALDVPGLVGRGKLASLTIAQLSKYCQVWRGGGGGSGRGKSVEPVGACAQARWAPCCLPLRLSRPPAAYQPTVLLLLLPWPTAARPGDWRQEGRHCCARHGARAGAVSEQGGRLAAVGVHFHAVTAGPALARKCTSRTCLLPFCPGRHVRCSPLLLMTSFRYRIYMLHSAFHPVLQHNPHNSVRMQALVFTPRWGTPSQAHVA